MRTGLLLIAAGCNFSASTDVKQADTGMPLADVDDDAGDGRGDGDSDPTPDPDETDDDRDGYTEANGDCDDDNPDIAPGVEDICDGADNDCDDEIDEDAASDDYEPNDTVDYLLGEVDDTIEVTGWLDDDGDVDRYRFIYADSVIDFDGLTVALTGLDGSVTYKMQIVDVATDEEVFNAFNTAEDTALEFELESTFGSDSTQFRVVISSLDGGDCANPYELEIVHSDWW